MQEQIEICALSCFSLPFFLFFFRAVLFSRLFVICIASAKRSSSNSSRPVQTPQRRLKTFEQTNKQVICYNDENETMWGARSLRYEIVILFSLVRVNGNVKSKDVSTSFRLRAKIFACYLHSSSRDGNKTNPHFSD